MPDHKKTSRKTWLAALLVVTAGLTPGLSPSVAASFNPNYIISDSEMRDANAMSFADIYSFLNQRGSLNDRFDVDPVDGLLKGTAQLVDDAAKRYSVNPKYVLVLMQKESGVVEAAAPTANRLEWATGYALCDGCYKSSELAQKYKGFSKQIDAGAGWMDWYMTNAADLSYLKQPGITYAMSDLQVTPANLATAGLYSYTPHLHGNQLLWNIWQRWFGEGAADIKFPDGTLLTDVDTGEFALIQGSQFRPITNLSVLNSRFRHLTPIELGDDDFRTVSQASPGRPIAFTDLALVRDETGAIFLLAGDERRPIESLEAFRLIGFNPEEIEDVLAADIEDYKLGLPIMPEESYPLGQLVQDSVTGAVFWVNSGVRHPIWDRSILDIRFTNQPIVQAAPTQLEMFIVGEPVTVPDGTLVKTSDDPTVYVIESGFRRPIPSEEVFLGYGYRWASVVTCSSEVLALHPVGDTLLLITGEDEGEVTAAAVGL